MGNNVDGNDSALAARATGNSWRDSVLRYYSLAKPRALYGNVLTAAAGFLFASPGRIAWALFLAVCLGTTLVIASACVLNNVLDRDIDTLMARTKKRATVTGGIAARNAVVYAATLGIGGMAILVAWTNMLVVAVGLVGFLAYVVLYGMFSKRMSIHGTLVGSVSGAAPIQGGYVGASNVLDAGALIVFLMLFFWQLPAFYSISIYRREEYARANVPVVSVVRGVANTKVQILVYTGIFVLVSLLPPNLWLHRLGVHSCHGRAGRRVAGTGRARANVRRRQQVGAPDVPLRAGHDVCHLAPARRRTPPALEITSAAKYCGRSTCTSIHPLTSDQKGTAME